MTISSDGYLYLNRGNSIYKVFRDNIDVANGENVFVNATCLYTHPDHIMNVQLRWISGREVVFFISHPSGETASIYFLNQDNEAVEYYRVDKLYIPDPCKPDHVVNVVYGQGNFAFDSENLYIQFQSGGSYIFRISGAGSEGVTGTPELIITRENPCGTISCGYSDHLYFLEHSDLQKPRSIFKYDFSKNLTTRIYADSYTKGFSLIFPPYVPPTSAYGIKWLQFALNKVLGDQLPSQLVLDGIYGPKTKAAVIMFQETNNLPTDGIAGPGTLKKMRPILDEKYNIYCFER